jgi:hypothetical protein
MEVRPISVKANRKGSRRNLGDQCYDFYSSGIDVTKHVGLIFIPKFWTNLNSIQTFKIFIMGIINNIREFLSI